MNRVTQLDHTGDLGLEIWAESLADLFTEAAKALFTTLVARGESQRSSLVRILEIEEDDLELLLVRWLQKLLFLFDTENVVLTGIRKLEVSERNLRAEIECISFDPQKDEILREIKAVTYHDLKVSRLNGGWFARVIFDL